MRDKDRLWWLMLIIGLAFCVGGVIAPYVGVLSIPTDNPYFTSADYWQLIGLIGFATLICLGGGLIFIVMAILARGRHRKRVAALHGDASAMPLAETRPDPALAPDVAEKPFEMMWRLSTVTKVVYVPLLGVYVLLGLLSIGVDIVILVAPVFVPPQPSMDDLIYHTLPQPMSVTEMILRVAGACLSVAVVIVLGVVIARAIPHLFGRPFGVTATILGVDARTELGSHVHMAWDEMRLLEVERGDTTSKRRFALYAQGKRIVWTEYAAGFGAQYVPVGATGSEMTLRQAALLGLIAARTGLAPRTLARAMERKPAPARKARRLSNSVALLVLTLILAGITAADFLFPVTPFPWVNWASAGSLTLATVCLIVASLWTAVARNTLPAHASPPSVGAPSLDAAGVAYVLTWRTSLLRRLLLIFIGLCLAVNLVPGAWALLLQLGLSLPGFHPQVLSDGVFAVMGRFVLGFTLGVFGLLGLGFVYGGVVAATVRIRADKDGLTTGSGRRQQLMAWSSVQDISWGTGGRGQFAYLVTSDVPTFRITWLAGPQVASAILPSDGAMPIGADELAALVAARIGKPIRVRE